MTQRDATLVVPGLSDLMIRLGYKDSVALYEGLTIFIGELLKLQTDETIKACFDRYAPSAIERKDRHPICETDGCELLIPRAPRAVGGTINAAPQDVVASRDARNHPGDSLNEAAAPSAITPLDYQALWATVRLCAEGSGWKRDAGESLVDWANRTLGARVALAPTAKGLNGWILPSIAPDTDRQVLMLMKDRGQVDGERITIGHYQQFNGWWRPRGSNGNFSDEVVGWQELPPMNARNAQEKT